MSQTPSTLSLVNKNILLGVTGGIAAYKSAELVRSLQKAGAQVRVVMTTAATEFITPLTLQALSGHPVHSSLLDPRAEAGMGHIELARWADLLLVAPATADFLARLVQGEGSELLSALCLATVAPILVAPAMNQEMWAKAITQQNVATLAKRGIRICGPAEGQQACGDVGPGRMLEVEDLVEQVAAQFTCAALAGKYVVITAGPTREPIDPVRYLSNRSSGKMGYALAEACVAAGARVTLVSGPVQLQAPEHVELISVETALQMHAATLLAARDANIVIGAAAVADYRPSQCAATKMKKTAASSLTLELVENPDIIADVAALEGSRYVVGFAAETNDLEQYATTKLHKKGLQAIFANNVSGGDVFDKEYNAVTIFTAQGTQHRFDLRSKKQLASDLIAWLAEVCVE